MKVQFKNWQAVAAWRWDIKTDTSDQPSYPTYNNEGDDDDEEEDEEEEDVCGICRLAFDSTCPECKIPGDDCPLMWGQCTHVFHMHCVLKWLDTESSKNQCPMDRRPWVTAERNDPASSPMSESPPQSPPSQHHSALHLHQHQQEQEHRYQQHQQE
ncbi:anaphase-promoting complex subunit apc11 [Phaffia rhodozyma]|uniref:Anaphase-promoting complex subunit 11 n=1 Tax=Phaffia rhodozyma TaxID=264483 RepID=A0A0F7SND6_PHARH|nr:anaphase-promoting complex subunit apc11 [Phaffia rhodozyma]